MAYLSIYYHIVFSTKNRANVLSESRRHDLYDYFWGILKNKKCTTYRIGGMGDHVHLLISLHPCVCLSDLIRDLKSCSSVWIKKNRVFPNFDGWQSEYGAFTKSDTDVNTVVHYIKNQKEHHHKETSKEEFIRLLKEAGVKYDETYL